METNKKIKVLVVPSDTTGVGTYRSINPHLALTNNYPDEFHVDIDFKPNLENDEWLKQYDIIHYHRSLGSFEKTATFLNKLDDLGIVSIMDLDDYWSPGTHHPAYLIIKDSKMDIKILDNLKSARNVTTTTDVFANEIRKYNKNVYVLPNAINPEEKQYIPSPEKSERIRFGWLGGSSHKRDLQLLDGVVNRLSSDGLIDKIQFVLCGFDTRGTITMIDQKSGQKTQRPIKPMESVWYEYEKIFTNNYSSVSPEYKKHLMKFINEEFPNIENESYRRVWTKPITTYASNYNLFDVSLAPLENNIFNKVKSQLKVIEAGFHKKAIIAQEFGPYLIDLEHAMTKGSKHEHPRLNETGNALLVSTVKNSSDWYKSIKKLINNPEMIGELSSRLYESVKDKYNINTVTSDRRDLYKKLLEK
jgi:glycosyltransferase involved in cell wall biosynthesis